MNKERGLQFEILSVFPLESKYINKHITSFKGKDVNQALRI